jgi:hypothetical protein
MKAMISRTLMPHTANMIAAVLSLTLSALIGAGAELQPALPVQTWRGHQHIMGFISITESGELRFARLLAEDCLESDHPGYWIESWKVDEIRRVFPAALQAFRFGDAIVIDGVKYVRVMPANPHGSLGNRTAKVETTEWLRPLDTNDNHPYR